MRPRRVIDEAILEMARTCILEQGQAVSTHTIFIAFTRALQTCSFRRHIVKDVYMTESGAAYLQDLVTFTRHAFSLKDDR